MQSSSTYFGGIKSILSFSSRKEDLKLPKPYGNEMKDIQPPYWEMTLVFNKNCGLLIKKDTKRQEEVKEIKRKVFSQDPERLYKGKLLRYVNIKSVGLIHCLA